MTSSRLRCRKGESRRLCFEPLESRTVLNSGWAISFGGSGIDRAKLVETDSVGNILVAGTFRGTVDFDPGPGTASRTSNGESDVFVAKYAPTGTLLWIASLGGAGTDNVGGLAIDANGNTWVGGDFTGTAQFGSLSLTPLRKSSDIYVAKLNESGEFVTAVQFGSPDPFVPIYYDKAGVVEGLASTIDGGVVVGGLFMQTVDFDPALNSQYLLSALGSDGRDGFVARLRSDGTFVWARRMGGSANLDIVNDVFVDGAGSGSIYLTGRVYGTADFGTDILTGAGGEIFVSKMTPDGNFEWTRRTSGGSDNHPEGIGADANGNVYITGEYLQDVDFDPGTGEAWLRDYGVFLYSLDAAGNYRFANRIGSGGSNNEWGLALEIGGDGYVYVAGREREGDFDPGVGDAYFTSEGDLDAFVAKYGYDGFFQGLWHWGGPGIDEATALDLIPGTTDLVVAGAHSGGVQFDTGSDDLAPVPSAGDFDAYLTRITQDHATAVGRVVGNLDPEVPHPLSGQLVYVDENGNRSLDTGEPTASTGTEGYYEFRHLEPGSHTIRLDVASPWTQTDPLTDDGGRIVPVTAGQYVSNASFVLGRPVDTLTLSSTNVPLSIPQLSPITSKLTVADTRPILDLNVRINIAYARPWDLNIYLIAPDGTRVELATDAGSDAAFYSNKVFSDEASNYLSCGTGWCAGTVRPEGLLRALDGKPLKGTWRLEITDDTKELPGNNPKKMNGTLLGWSLIATVDSASRRSAATALINPPHGTETAKQSKVREFVFGTQQDFVSSAGMPLPLATARKQLDERREHARKANDPLIDGELELTGVLKYVAPDLGIAKQ